jgi:putative resolvase
VSSHDQRGDLDRQVARLSEWAAQAGQPAVRVEAEVGSAMNGARTKLRRLLSDPTVTTVVVEHGDRLGRMNTELVDATLAASGRRLVITDDGEVDDDLVRDVTEVLTSFCARLSGRRGLATGQRRHCAVPQETWGRWALSHLDETLVS